MAHVSAGGGRARRSLLVRLQPEAVERLDLRPVSLLEHLDAGAELVVELPPTPLVLGLIQGISSTSLKGCLKIACGSSSEAGPV